MVSQEKFIPYHERDEAGKKALQAELMGAPAGRVDRFRGIGDQTLEEFVQGEMTAEDFVDLLGRAPDVENDVLRNMYGDGTGIVTGDLLRRDAMEAYLLRNNAADEDFAQLPDRDKILGMYMPEGSTTIGLH